VPPQLSLSGRQCQTRLAHAAWANQCEQAVWRISQQQTPDCVELRIASDEACQLCWQIVRWGGELVRPAGLGLGLLHCRVYRWRYGLRAWWCHLPGADRLVERRGFLLRLRTELRLQHADALLVLARRGCMLPRERVEAHQRAVCRFMED